MVVEMHPADFGFLAMSKEAEGGGDCYMVAGQWVCFNPGYTLSHAEVTPIEGGPFNSPLAGISHGHAFNTYRGDAHGEVIENEDDYDVQTRGYPADWVYDATMPEGHFLRRAPADLYYRMAGVDPDKVIHYTPEEAGRLQLEHEHYGPYDERAKEWR